MHNTSMGYPDILRQAPIFYMNTQKKHQKRERIRKFISSNYRGVFFNNIVLPIPTPSFTIATYGSPWWKKINLSN